MKGLIYKDFIVCRKTLAMAYIYCVLFAVVGILCRLSMICGNLANNQEVIESLNRNVWLFRYAPCAAFMATSTLNTIFSDKNCGWLTYSYTTPIGEKRIVAAKMLFNTLLSTTAYLISILYLSVFLLFEGSTPSFKHLGYITGFYLFFLAFSFLNTLLSNVFQKKQTVDMVLVGSAGIFSLCITPILFKKMESHQNDPDIDLFDIFREDLNSIKDWFLPAAFALLVIMGVLCFIISVRTLQRREN